LKQVISPEALVSLLFPPAILALILIYAFAIRYLTFRERMAMIEKGIFPVETKAPRDLLLQRGIITAMTGLALTIGLGTLGLSPWLLFGLIPMFVGVAMLISYYLGPAEGAEED